MVKAISVGMRIEGLTCIPVFHIAVTLPDTLQGFVEACGLRSDASPIHRMKPFSHASLSRRGDTCAPTGSELSAPQCWGGIASWWRRITRLVAIGKRHHDGEAGPYDSRADHCGDEDRGSHESLRSHRTEVMCILDMKQSANQSSPMPRTNIEIGRDYERFVGYCHELENWEVRYSGIIHGMADRGRDLICHRDSEVLIVQCKCWASTTEIDLESVQKLHLTTERYAEMANPRNQLWLDLELPQRLQISALLVTSTRLSKDAQTFAKAHRIEVRDRFFLKPYPKVKCVCREGFYYLEHDLAYDSVKIRIAEGDGYVATEEEARQLGYSPAARATEPYSGLCAARRPESSEASLAAANRQPTKTENLGAFSGITIPGWAPVPEYEIAQDLRALFGR